jgi:hypothetical protein
MRVKWPEHEADHSPMLSIREDMPPVSLYISLHCGAAAKRAYGQALPSWRTVRSLTREMFTLCREEDSYVSSMSQCM